MSDSSPAKPLLQVRGIGKSFPGVRALNEVDLSVGHSQVLGLIGENGAGKSTLMKILAGVQPPDEGQILIEGQVVTIDSTREALSLGIEQRHFQCGFSDHVAAGVPIEQRAGVVNVMGRLANQQRILNFTKSFYDLINFCGTNSYTSGI